MQKKRIEALKAPEVIWMRLLLAHPYLSSQTAHRKLWEGFICSLTGVAYPGAGITQPEMATKRAIEKGHQR